MIKKEDLTALESRLHQDLASKEDLRRDLKDIERKLVVELIKTNGKMDAMEDRIMAKMNAGFDRITMIVDSFASKIETYARETLTIPKTLDEHGKRISRLEEFHPRST